MQTYAEQLGKLIANLHAQLGVVQASLLDLDARLQAIERILRDPILAAQLLPGLGLVSAPLTGESHAPSGAPSGPGTRSG